MIRHSVALLALLIVGALGLKNTAHAALLAYDGFEDGGSTPGAGQYRTGSYTDDVLTGNLVDAPNTTPQGPDLLGFSAANAWDSNSDFASWIYYRTASGGLSYDGLSTTDGQVEVARTTGSPGDKSVNRDATTTDVSPVQWISFLVNADAAFADNGSTFDVELRWDITQNDGPTDRPLTLMLDGDGNVLVDPTVDVTGNESIDDSGTGLTTDTTHLFVFKIEGDLFTDADFQNGRLYDAYTLYIDPDLSLGEAGLAGSSAQTLSGRGIFRDNIFGSNDNTRAAFGNIELQSRLVNPSKVIFDEFRLGTTFDDVAPSNVIPEPSTYLVFSGLALCFGVAGWWRKRRQAAL